MEEENKILGITEEELAQVKEDLDIDEIEDFDVQETPAEYSIYIVVRDQQTSNEILLDSNYTDEVEARKCYEYFSVKENFDSLISIKREKPQSIAKMISDSPGSKVFIELRMTVNNEIMESEEIEIK